MTLDSASHLLGQPRKRRPKRSLATLLRERGVLTVPHAVDVALDICDLLAPAHESGVVHGQLGLGCVRLAFSPTSGPRDVEIFTLNAGADESGAVQASAFVEPHHRGDPPRVDARSDIWAIGALLYTMVVGKVPPAGEAHVRVPDDGATRSLASVIEACLSPDRDDRPSSVDDLSEKLGSFSTWPPDQFARLAQRRERRVSAERVRQHRERLGLGNVPNVLDKLDDAALARAQRDTTAAISSVLHGSSTEAALERLMTAVHEGTDAARIELAAALPALVDFDDEDEVVLPTMVEVADETSPIAPITSPLAMPLALPAELAPALLPTPLPSASAGAPTRATRLVLSAVAAVAISLGAGYGGYVWSSTASAAPASAATATATAATTATVHATTSAAPPPTAPAIPVFSPSSLPAAPPVTPASLPDAKR